MACPENLIVVGSQRNEKTRRKELTEFTYDLSRCMFCGLCEDACPVDALELTQDFEMAQYNRVGLIWNRETLEKEFRTAGIQALNEATRDVRHKCDARFGGSPKHTCAPRACPRTSAERPERGPMHLSTHMKSGDNIRQMRDG